MTTRTSGQCNVVHASGLGLDVADIFSDTLYRDHARSQAYRIATPSSRLTAARLTTDMDDLIVVDLRNRSVAPILGLARSL